MRTILGWSAALVCAIQTQSTRRTTTLSIKQIILRSTFKDFSRKGAKAQRTRRRPRIAQELTEETEKSVFVTPFALLSPVKNLPLHFICLVCLCALSPLRETI